MSPPIRASATAASGQVQTIDSAANASSASHQCRGPLSVNPGGSSELALARAAGVRLSDERRLEAQIHYRSLLSDVVVRRWGGGSGFRGSISSRFAAWYTNDATITAFCFMSGA